MGMLFLLCLPIRLLAQESKSVSVQISKTGEIGRDTTRYEAIIANNSDTPICVLYSVFLKFHTAIPQALPLYTVANSKEIYSLHYSSVDTSYNFERPLYFGECLLPHQTAHLDIQIKNSYKEKMLSFEYFYVLDFCYNTFSKEMSRAAIWYNKYHRLEYLAAIPK
jgi:hypothetical protein